MQLHEYAIGLLGARIPGPVLSVAANVRIQVIYITCITVFLYQYNFLFGILLGVVCLASTVAHARQLGAHCRHSNAEIPRQCEADMSGKSVPHHEETG